MYQAVVTIAKPVAFLPVLGAVPGRVAHAGRVTHQG